MAACGSLQHIFENPLPENLTLLESLSPWSQIKPVKKPSNIEESSFTEIFGELHFKENSLLLSSFSSSSLSSAPVSSSSSSSLVDLDPQSKSENSYHVEKKIITPSFEYSSSSKYNGSHRKTDSFSLRNSESLQLCTEGLGFESSDYKVEDLTKDVHNWQKPDQEKEKPSVDRSKNSSCISGENVKRSRTAGAGGRKGGFPPPISCLSKSGQPWVCFKSYRHDGRFVLKEIRVRSQEFLHACREDGRLKMHFVQPNDEIPQEEEENEEDTAEDPDDDQEEDGADNYDDKSEEDDQ